MTAREPRRHRAGRHETPGNTQLSGRTSRARANARTDARTASGPSPAQVVRPQVAEVERERFEAEALGQVVGQAGRERLDGAPHEAPPGLASGCPIAYGEQRGRDAARGEHGSEGAGEEGLERGRWVRTQTHGAPVSERGGTFAFATSLAGSISQRPYPRARTRPPPDIASQSRGGHSHSAPCERQSSFDVRPRSFAGLSAPGIATGHNTDGGRGLDAWWVEGQTLLGLASQAAASG